MARLLVHVEGQTEETFVNEILAPHLYGKGYSLVAARLLGNVRQRSRRGGITAWPSAKMDIIRHLQEDRGSVVTMMVDYYGLPQSGERAWPGRAHAANAPVSKKSHLVEASLLGDVAQTMGGNFSTRRFVPYVMMHEFEGLLFSDCTAFARGIGQPNLASNFQDIRDQFDSPEHINDSPITAPSKRVIALVPNYEKPLQGVLAALEIGMSAIQSECACFRDWLGRLELSATAA